jgi:hypothetical protein
MQLFVRIAMAAAMGFACCAADGRAQGKGDLHIDVNWTGVVDCDRPLRVRGFVIRGRAANTLSSNGTAVGTWTFYAPFATTVQLRARAGQPPVEVPGGKAQLRVMGKNHLRFTVDTLQNYFFMNLITRGQSCAITFDTKLKPGFSEYTLYHSGFSTFYYCAKPRLLESDCKIY